MSTELILKHHTEALAAGDLEAILEDYTDGSVFIQGADVMKGLDAIRGVFQAATSAGIFAQLEVTHQVIEGDCAYMVWSVPNVIPFGTDTFVVADGKIRLQTVALHTG